MEGLIYGDIIRVKSTGVLLHYLWGNDMVTLVPDIPGYGRLNPEKFDAEMHRARLCSRDNIEYVGHREGYMVDLSPSKRGRQEFTSSRESPVAA